MKKIKILDPVSAIRYSVRLMDKANMYLYSGHKSTKYFGKRGSPYKIRISDHIDPKKNDDVIAEIIFNYDTIQADVETRISQALIKYERTLNMAWHKRV